MKKLENFLFDTIICVAFGYFGGWLFLYFCCNGLVCDMKSPPAAMVASPEVMPVPAKVLSVAKSDKAKNKKNRKADK